MRTGLVHGPTVSLRGQREQGVRGARTLAGVDDSLARERFRLRSRLGDRATGLVAGFGVDGYLLALRALVSHLLRRGAGTVGSSIQS